METFQLNNHRNLTYIAIAILALVLSTLALDLVYSRLHNTSYYLSESLLFSSFWWILIPLLIFYHKLFLIYNNLNSRLVITVAFWIIHLLVYPAIVQIISYIFFSHTFSYSQTFYFSLTEYALKSALIYIFTGTFLTYLYSQSKKNITVYQHFLTVTENNKTFTISVEDILYISANTPYLNIHQSNKKSLYSETLKSLEKKLDPHQFVRVHKSHTVNIKYVSAYQSRLNGDYDLTLTDDTVLRVSRNYAQTFKEVFKKSHPLTTE